MQGGWKLDLSSKNEPNRRWSIERMFWQREKRRTGAPSCMNGTILLRSALKNKYFFCRKECCRYLSLPSNHHMVILNQEHLLGAETSNLLYFQPENWEKMECNLTCAYFSNGSVETINYWGSPPWGGRSSIAARLAGVVWVSLPPRKKRGGFGNRFCLGYGIHNQEHGGKTTIQKGQNLWFDFFDSTCFCKKNWWGSIRYPLNLCQIRWFVRRINFKLHQVEGTKGCIQSFLHAPRFFFESSKKPKTCKSRINLHFHFIEFSCLISW